MNYNGLINIDLFIKAMLQLCDARADIGISVIKRQDKVFHVFSAIQD